MKHLPHALLVVSLLCGCAIGRDGAHVANLPPPVQGPNDVQGAPMSVPGAGMGVGAGSTGMRGPGAPVGSGP